ncbi:MAG: metal ABC transporter permease [Candidatus Methanodesulfokora sp.]|jgi:ABC-type Mn2+/Zn2+ transport system permease subunit
MPAGDLDVFLSGFMIRALIAVVMSSILSAVIGSFAVVRGLSTMGAAVAHASLAGALLGFLLNKDPTTSALVLSILFAVAAAYSGEKSRGRMDIVLGVTFGFSAAIAALSLSMTREYTVAAYSYLIGDVLGVSWNEVAIQSVFSFASLLIIYLFYKEFKFISFDMEAAEAMGLRTRLYHYTMVVLLAVAMVVELKVVGSILAVVFLVAPAASALEMASNMEKIITLSVSIALISSLSGIMLSVFFNVPTGPTIGIIASLIYLLALLLSPKRK